ncbi:hypothetical protein L9F63_000981, partial [Diploptera punctata]
LSKCETSNKRKQNIIENQKTVMSQLEDKLKSNINIKSVNVSEMRNMKNSISNFEEQISCYKREISELIAEKENHIRMEEEFRNELESKISQLLIDVKEKSELIENLKNENNNKLLEVSKQYESQLSAAREQISRLESIRREFAVSLEKFLVLIRTYAAEKAGAEAEKNHVTRKESHGKVCSILNITNRELHQLLGTSYFTDTTNLKFEKLTQECSRIISMEELSQKLPDFLFKASCILLEN